MEFSKLSCYVLMAMIFFAAMIAAGSCETELTLTESDDDDGWSEEFADVAADAVKYFTRMSDMQRSSASVRSMDCTGLECKFCVDTKIPKVNQVCLELSLVPEEVAAVGQLTVNGKRIIKKKVSVKEATKVCIPIPATPGKVCIALDDVNFDSNSFRGCFKLSFKVVGVSVFSIQLGCMNANLRGRSAKILFSETTVEDTAAYIKANYDKEL